MNNMQWTSYIAFKNIGWIYDILYNNVCGNKAYISIVGLNMCWLKAIINSTLI